MMTINEFEHVVSEIKTHTKHIYLHVQGEPYMHPKLMDFMNIAQKYKLKVHLVTNGTYLSHVEYKLYSHPALAQLSISLHALEISEKDNNHQVLKRLIEDSSKRHFSLFLRIWRFDEYESRSKMSKMINIDLDRLPMKRSRISDNLFVDLDETFTWPSLNNPYISETGYCHSGTKLLAILSDGTVTPCCLDAEGILKLGNIHQDHFESMLKSVRLTNLNRCLDRKSVV